MSAAVVILKVAGNSDYLFIYFIWFNFTLTTFVFSSKYFEQSFNCVKTLGNVDTKMKHFDFF